MRTSSTPSPTASRPGAVSRRSPPIPIACGTRTNRSPRTCAPAACAGSKPALALGKVDGARKAALPASIDAAARDARRRRAAGRRLAARDQVRRLPDAVSRRRTANAGSYSRNGKDWTQALPRHRRRGGAPAGGFRVDRRRGRRHRRAGPHELPGAAERCCRTARRQSRSITRSICLYLDGYDLRAAPLSARKALLRKLVGEGSAIRYSDHVEGNGAAFFAEACKLGLEGIISKRAESTYQATRGRDWQKVKCSMRQEFVIGGYTDPQGSRTGFGALLLGVYEGADLRYCGQGRHRLQRCDARIGSSGLKKRATDKSPFVNPPTGAEGRRAHWVKPDLVGEVSFTEWTRDATLRHPSFQGLREDKRARDVVREQPVHAAHAPMRRPGRTKRKRRRRRARPLRNTSPPAVGTARPTRLPASRSAMATSCSIPRPASRSAISPVLRNGRRSARAARARPAADARPLPERLGQALLLPEARDRRRFRRPSSASTSATAAVCSRT